MKQFTILKLAGAISAAALLSACASDYDVEGTKAMATQGTAFHAALQQNYADFASWEQQEGDWTESIVYLNKAKAAAAGQTPALDPAPNAELAVTRDKVSAFIAKTMNTDPKAAATAQVGYDCVAHEVDENVHPNEDAHGCIAMLDAAMAMPTAAAKPVVSVAMPAPFIVYFDFASSELTAESKATLAEIAGAYGKFNPGTVKVQGNADTVGSNAFNMALSQKRAAVVANMLANDGIPGSTMDLEAYGEDKLKVSTPDNTKEPRNRRVEIHFMQ